MALLPVAPLRLSEALRSQRLVHQVQTDQRALHQLFDQLSSGRRFLSGADDPGAATRAVGLQRSIDYVSQVQRNATSMISFLNATDQVMAEVDDRLIEVRGIALQAAQTVLSDEERSNLADSVHQAMLRLVSAGNTAFRDHSLLGGALQRGAPLQAEGDSVLFRGSDAVGRTRLAAEMLSATATTAPEALGLAGPQVVSDDLAPALRAATPLSDVRGGAGIDRGVLRFSDGGDWVEVDLRAAATMGELAAKIDGVEVGGRSLSVTIQADGLSIDYADGLGGTLAISDAPGGKLARQLNLNNPDGMLAPPISGVGMAPRLTSMTRLADLQQGAGIDASEGLRIRQGTEEFVVDLSQATTVGDLIAAMERSGADVRVEIDPAAGTLQVRPLRSGVDYGIGEDGGQVATALGLRTATAQTRLDQLGREGQLIRAADGYSDLTLTRPDGVELEFSLDALVTVGDLLDAINDHPNNQDADRVAAGLALQGNGIVLEAPDGAGTMTLRSGPGSNIGQLLGLIPAGEDEVTAVVEGTEQRIGGKDYAPVEAGGTIDALLRLERAIRDGDIPEIERLSKRLDDDLRRAVSLRGRLGLQVQEAMALRTLGEDHGIALQERLANEVDADMAELINQLSSRQNSLEASLRLMGKMAEMTLLNFL